MLPEMTVNGDFYRLVVVGLDPALLVQDRAVVLCFDISLKRQSREVALHRSTQFPDTRVKSATVVPGWAMSHTRFLFPPRA